MSGYTDGKSLDELIEMLVGTAEPGSPVYEQIRMAITVQAMRENSRRAVVATWIAGVAAAAAVASAIAAFAA